MTEQKIAYEQHPVTLERKAELRGKGYVILDARFRPAGDVQVTEPAGEGDDGLTVDFVRAKLEEAGIPYGDRLQLPGLTKLATEHGIELVTEPAGEGDDTGN